MARFCVHCGRPVAPEFRFCAACGKPIAAAVPPPAPVAAPVKIEGERPPQYSDPQFLAVATPPAVTYDEETVEAPVEAAAEERPAVQTVVVEAPPAEAFRGDGVCPACGGDVHRQAVLCVHCGRQLRDVKTGKKV